MMLPCTAAPSLFPDLTRDDVFHLETRRLWLRWPRLSDAPAVLRQAGDRAVAEMTALIPHPYPREAAEPFLFETRKGNALGNQLVLAVAPKLGTAGRGRDIMGMVGVHAGQAGVATLGYWLGSDHWGEGYGTEAVQALIDATFSLTGIEAIEADVRVINPASRRVLEKSGFRPTGSRLKAFPARGGLFPCEQFMLDRRTWIALKSWQAGGLGMAGWALEAAPSRRGAWSEAECPA